jgi:integrase
MKNLYQQGSLRLRKRVRGSAIWEFRYRVPGTDGRRQLKSVTVGSVEQYPTAASARQKVQALVLAINASSSPQGDPLVGSMLDRFISEEHLEEIVAGTNTCPETLHYTTARGYLTMINNYIRPRWGASALSSLRPAAIQQWLNNLPNAPKTKGNIRALLHRLYEKAMLWEVVALQRNPIDLIEVRGVSRRRNLPTVLSVEQFQAIRDSLPEPHRTMVVVAQCTGLRVSEILALQWPDFDFDSLTLKITRAVVNGRIGEVKTECSNDLLPIDGEVAKAVLTWREKAPPSPGGWVFANPVTLKPYFASFMKPYFRRIGAALGIRLGWHTFRHTYRTWLDATGAPIGVQQKLMRHAQVSTTMNIYGNALMTSKRDANSKVVGLALATM